MCLPDRRPGLPVVGRSSERLCSRDPGRSNGSREGEPAMTRLTPARLIPPVLNVLGLLLFMSWTAPAKAGYVDYDVTRARLGLQRADYLLGDAQWAADVARDDFERADRRAAELAEQVDRQQRDIDDIGRRFDEASRAAKWLREDLDRWNERAEARQKELEVAGEKLRAAREALDKVTADATAKF